MTRHEWAEQIVRDVASAIGASEKIEVVEQSLGDIGEQLVRAFMLGATWERHFRSPMSGWVDCREAAEQRLKEEGLM